MSAATSSREKIFAKLENYYRLHARIYDATRWTFLFGRAALIDTLARELPAAKQILEVGCGTGKNLQLLAKKFPEAQITGLDLSKEMLAVAQKNTEAFGKRVKLLRRAYRSVPRDEKKTSYDLIIFSYSLTMMNPGWKRALEEAAQDLGEQGLLAVVDFHDTPFSYFEKWMDFNHVRMKGQLLPILEKNFATKEKKLLPAYAGVWNYFLFLGKKRRDLESQRSERAEKFRTQNQKLDGGARPAPDK